MKSRLEQIRNRRSERWNRIIEYLQSKEPMHNASISTALSICCPTIQGDLFILYRQQIVCYKLTDKGQKLWFLNKSNETKTFAY